MGLWFNSFLTELLVVIVFLLAAAILYTRHIFTYWKRHGVEHLEPSFPFGCMAPIVFKKQSFGSCFKGIYDHFKALKQPVGGYHRGFRPELMIIDPEILKQILGKDFHYFTDRDIYIDEKNDPLTCNLFSLKGAQWKNMRNKLTPTFTSGKIKLMFHSMVACSVELNKVLEESIVSSDPLDIKDFLGRFTTDIIGTCAFGIECNCLRNPDADFRKFGVAPFEPKGVERLRHMATLFIPDVLKFFKIPAFNKSTRNFFMGIVTETVKYREENNIIRKDFMQLLLQLKNQGKLADEGIDHVVKNKSVLEDGKGLTVEQMLAQCFVFFMAGFETSATTMTFCLYELAKNPDIQEKVRREVVKVIDKYNGELTYDGVMEMQYMDKVVNETLRKYPPLPHLVRRCTEDYKLPDTDYVIKKGYVVRVSLFGLHRDAEYYPNPDTFDPERFNDDERAKRPNCTFLPFGDGPRNCIGVRFGLMQVKVGLSSLLKNFRFTPNEKTVEPIIMNPMSIILTTQGGIWLNAHKVA